MEAILNVPGSRELRLDCYTFAIIWNLLKAREKSRVHGGIVFCFASHWLKNWRQSFKPIIKRSNCNHVITFYSHLKTALTGMDYKKYLTRVVLKWKDWNENCLFEKFYRLS